LLAATGTTLLPEFLPPLRRGDEPHSDASALAGLTRFIQQRLQGETSDLYAEYQAMTDRHLLSEVIRHTRGNLSQAARLLGIARATLRTKLETLEISASNDATGDGDAPE
jgi:two-component system nitrogen regulation response regulator GlnG